MFTYRTTYPYALSLCIASFLACTLTTSSGSIKNSFTVRKLIFWVMNNVNMYCSDSIVSSKTTKHRAAMARANI